MSMIGKVSRDKIDNAKIERDKAVNPVSAEPGMDDDAWGISSGDDDVWGTSGGGESSGFGDTGAWGADSAFSSGGGFGGDSGFGTSTAFGGGAWGGFGGGFGSPEGGAFGGAFGAQPQQQEPKKSAEDKAFDLAVKGGKFAFTFIKELTQTFRTATKHNYMGTGRSMIFTGVGMTVVGVFLAIFGFLKGLAVPLVVSGILTVGLGIPLFMTMYSRIIKSGELEEGVSQEQGMSFSDGDPFAETGEFSDEDSWDASPSVSGWDTGDSDDWDSSGWDAQDDVEDGWGAGFEDSSSTSSSSGFSFDAFDDVTDDSLSPSLSDTLSYDEGVSKIEEMSDLNGMYTRQYLYENLVPLLPNINKDFAKVISLSEGDAEFDAWNGVIYDTAQRLKPKPDSEIPILESLEEYAMFYKLVVKRTPWLKTETQVSSFLDELVRIYSFVEEEGKYDPSKYGSFIIVGDYIHFTIMNGKSPMISLRDIIEAQKTEILDTKKKMPVVIGVTERGTPVIEDFFAVDSLLVSGESRSGKTWWVISLLAMMCMFNSPSKMHFYVLDPKASTSDLNTFNLPHIRKFSSTQEEILETLRYLLEVEKPRRSALFAKRAKETGRAITKITDYNDVSVGEELPFIYLIIDEVATITSWGKDFTDKFYDLIMPYLTQTANVGFRIIALPHLIRDNILKKQVTDLISYRVAVRADATQVEQAMGTTSFKYRLVNKGDLAVKNLERDIRFVKGSVVTTSVDDNAKFFDLLGRVWKKLDPEGSKGSAYERRIAMESVVETKPKSNIKFVDPTQSTLSSSTPSSGGTKLSKQDQKLLLADLNRKEGLTPSDLKLSDDIDLLD